MNRRLTGRALAGAAAVLVLAGGGVAVAAGTNGKSSTTTTPGDTAARPTPPTPPRGPGHPGGPGGPGPIGGPGLEFGSAAADYLGLDAEELRERLIDGRSLAEIARAEGKSVEGLEEALVAAFREHVDDLVNATPPRRPAFGRGFRDGKRGWHHGPWDRDGRAAGPDRADRSDEEDEDDRTP
ncbi:hypothetical protein VSS74_28255 [Conexibacter stalactiti]|uniref:Helix-turn-helix domain-containing protein n=1 Tax=Conexibacter stalactiti TaxID=1940611 RepID=A0ABU4HYP8_9ACTN|nr:hypothetical protein [Conexibacter stalactiti]MDW5598284.1 hypothetical protein [Conexibacter stalactiti]MEC5038926.1 hypothetical protein [Conexibacter stalactiti]